MSVFYYDGKRLIIAGLKIDLIEGNPISHNTKKQIDDIIARYPENQSVIIENIIGCSVETPDIYEQERVDEKAKV